ncbi:hypothetical protein BOH66_08745 [Microbacterium aurum]|uniref:Uncharacterized protein n=1 Tax=Microbacterium aurum TaxID=36805 RepID=A0A1P8U873_9MICO|nr:hypothetical protein BOH66_08745 [Microbacterium aurum]
MHEEGEAALADLVVHHRRVDLAGQSMVSVRPDDIAPNPRATTRYTAPSLPDPGTARADAVPPPPPRVGSATVCACGVTSASAAPKTFART